MATTPPPILYGVLPSFLPVGHPAGLDGFVDLTYLRDFVDLTYLRDSLTNIRIRVLSPGRPSFSTPPLICHTAPPPPPPFFAWRAVPNMRANPLHVKFVALPCCQAFPPPPPVASGLYRLFLHLYPCVPDPRRTYQHGSYTYVTIMYDGGLT